jgi:hypothetical protein
MPSHNLRLSIPAPQSDIYARWITPGRALDFSALSAIPIDHKPIEKTTTIYDLKGIAIERVYRCPTVNEASTIEDFTVEIFSLPCAVADASMTLECLGCAEQWKVLLMFSLFREAKEQMTRINHFSKYITNSFLMSQRIKEQNKKAN